MKVRAHIGADDVVAALGAALVCLGLALIYVPLALIVSGLAIVALAIWRL